MFGYGNASFFVEHEGIAYRFSYEKFGRERLSNSARVLDQLKRIPQLGPSMLDIMDVGTWYEQNELPKDVENAYSRSAARKKPPLGREPIFVQKMEYSGLGDLTKYEDRFDNDNLYEDGCMIAFFLMWFFGVAQTECGFGHYDLKLDNIIMRRYNHVQVFPFKLDDDTIFNVPAKFVPVVIDFDYATSNILEKREQPRLDSYSVLPPESLLKLKYEHFKNDTNDTIDWYSMGMTLLHFFTRRKLDKRKAYEGQGALTGFLSGELLASGIPLQKNSLHSTLYDLCMARACVVHLALFPEDESMEPLPFIKGAIDESEFATKKDVKDDIELIRKELARYRGDDVKEMLRTLLSWDRETRVANGTPLNHLKRLRIFEKFRAREPVSYTTLNPIAGRRERDAASALASLESPVCVACRMPTRWQCSCKCAQPFCGTACQNRWHL